MLTTMKRLMTSCLVISALIASSQAIAAEAMKPVQIYILAGQSNMEGHAKVETFDYIGDDPATAPMLQKMQDSDGTPRICDDVWISYLTGMRGENGHGSGKLTAGYGSRQNPAENGGKIGPEFTFGIYMSEAVDAPILIIKTAWGGKSLFHDFRPPSAGPYPRTIDDIEKDRYTDEATGHYYRLMIDHVNSVLSDINQVYPNYDEQQGYEIAGFAWFQGWNDMCNRGVYPDPPIDKTKNRFADYTVWMEDFIRDVRKDLDTPKMPFVIGVLGAGGPDANEGNLAFREAMADAADLPEFQGNVTAVRTAPYWDMPLAEIDAKRGQVKQMGYLLRTENKNHANSDGSMSPTEQREYVTKYEAELISPEELARWERGASNAGYHYLGCAKTLGQIGKAFADAMLQMQAK